MTDSEREFMDQIKSDFVQRLKSIIDTAIDGIITIDNRGRVETINPAAAKLFGYSPEEVIGNNVHMLMPEPYLSEHDGYLERYQRTKVPHIIGIGREVSGKTKSGEVFPLRLAVSEVVLNDRIIYTGIIHDLTDVKAAQSEILALNKKLEDKVAERTYELEKVVNRLLATNSDLSKEVKERMAVSKKLQDSEAELRESLEKEKELSELKSRFVAMASHEFRTPLTTILSSATLIGKYPKEEQQANREKHVERIKSAVTNLTGILNDFLSLSKLEEGIVEVSKVAVDMLDLCQSVRTDVKGIAHANREIHHRTTGTVTEVHTDPRILKNILFNLVSNALKYSEDDIDCHFIFDDKHLVIEVTDKGIGIPEEDQKYMFTRFFRAGNVTNIQGTGLGLNIVRRYAELLDGSISFVSKQEVGSTFRVTLPLQQN